MSRGLRFAFGAVTALMQIALSSATATEGSTVEQHATPVGNALYQFLREIPVGGEGGWEILTIDNAARRLYFAHATKVVVVALHKHEVVGEVAEPPGAHAFVVVLDLQHGFL